MAVISCYECGGKVSTSAAACPHCGAPSQQQPNPTDANKVAVNLRDATAAKEEKNEDRDIGGAKKVTNILGGAIQKVQAKEKRVLKKAIVGCAFFVVFAIIVILIGRSQEYSSSTLNDQTTSSKQIEEQNAIGDSPAVSTEAISLINAEGNTISCLPKVRGNCVRDAEAKGFVKISDAEAGIKVDWKATPLKIVEVRGTAAQAGVRNGDILIQLDGNEITNAFSIFTIMRRKQPGDKLAVKVLRAGTQLYFVYNLMPRNKPRQSPSEGTPANSYQPSKPGADVYNSLAQETKTNELQRTESPATKKRQAPSGGPYSSNEPQQALRQKAAAQEALNELKKLGSALQVGLSLEQYTNRLIDRKIAVEEKLSLLQDDSVIKQQLTQSLQAFVDGGEVWRLTIKAKYDCLSVGAGSSGFCGYGGETFRRDARTLILRYGLEPRPFEYNIQTVWEFAFKHLNQAQDTLKQP